MGHLSIEIHCKTLVAHSDDYALALRRPRHRPIFTCRYFLSRFAGLEAGEAERAVRPGAQIAENDPKPKSCTDGNGRYRMLHRNLVVFCLSYQRCRGGNRFRDAPLPKPRRPCRDRDRSQRACRKVLKLVDATLNSRVPPRAVEVLGGPHCAPF